MLSHRQNRHGVRVFRHALDVLFSMLTTTHPHIIEVKEYTRVRRLTRPEPAQQSTDEETVIYRNRYDESKCAFGPENQRNL
jgi:hypothetical protein